MATRTSAASGGFRADDADTWGLGSGVYPATTDNIIIAAGHNITLKEDNEVAYFQQNGSSGNESTLTLASHTLTINSRNSSNSRVIDVGNSYCNIAANTGKIKLAGTADAAHKLMGLNHWADELHDLEVATSGSNPQYRQEGDVTINGTFTITSGSWTTNTSNHALTVDEEINITGTLSANASAVSCANMEINNGGTYNATSGTTTITAASGGSTSGRAYWSHTGGTMRHNFGTFSFPSGAQVEPGGPADAGAGGMDAHSFWNLTSAGSLLPKTQRFVVGNDLETNGEIGYNGNAYWMEIYGTWTHKSGSTNNSDTGHSSRGYVRNMVLEGGELDLEKMNMTFGSFRSTGNGVVKGGTDSG